MTADNPTPKAQSSQVANRVIKFRAYQRQSSLHRKPGIYEVAEIVWYDPLTSDEYTGEVFFTDAPADSEFLEDVILMQSTGLTDKNGVEIFERDIVTTDCPEYMNLNDNWVIEYGSNAAFNLSAIPMRSFKESISDLVLNKWHMEVIGNIYENPELLS